MFAFVLAYIAWRVTEAEKSPHLLGTLKIPRTVAMSIGAGP